MNYQFTYEISNFLNLQEEVFDALLTKYQKICGTETQNNKYAIKCEKESKDQVNSYFVFKIQEMWIKSIISRFMKCDEFCYLGVTKCAGIDC